MSFHKEFPLENATDVVLTSSHPGGEDSENVFRMLFHNFPLATREQKMFLPFQSRVRVKIEM